MAEDTQLQVINDGSDLSLSRPAEAVYKEAEMVVTPWSRRVEELQLFKIIGSSKHLYIEAWQMLAAAYRVTARVRETRYIEMGDVHGYECTAESYHMPTGQVISTADAMCLSDEENWGPRPKYEWKSGKKTQVGYVGTPLQQLRSMAQTRACSKVLSNLFKWVVRLKGYQGTPAEEMTGNEYDTSDEQPQRQQPQRKSQPAQQRAAAPAPTREPGNGEKTISEAQAKRLYAIAMNSGYDSQSFPPFLASLGYHHSREIPASEYDAIVSQIERREGDE